MYADTRRTYYRVNIVINLLILLKIAVNLAYQIINNKISGTTR